MKTAKHFKGRLTLPFPNPYILTSFFHKILIWDSFISDCPLPNLRHAGRNINIFHRIAISKCFFPNGLHGTGDLYICQIPTALKSLCCYPNDSFWNFQGHKAISFPLIGISHFSHIHHSFWLAFQPCGACKGFMPDLFYSVWDYNMAQITATFKSIIPNLYDIIWNNSSFEAFASFEQAP